MNIYNYILIIFLIIILYIITHEDFDSCKIKSCKSGYSLSLYSEKCCPSKDNVSSYNNTDCKILGCNAGYTLSDDKQSCCKNVVSNATNFDASCNITKCSGSDIISGDKKSCCLALPGTSTYNSTTCKPTACSTNYKLSKSGDFCCWNSGNLDIEYTNNGTACTISKCPTNNYLSNGICNYCDPNGSNFISKDGKNCRKYVKGASTYLDNGDVNTCIDGYNKWDANTCDCNWNKEKTYDDLINMVKQGLAANGYNDSNHIFSINLK